jgi:glyoxylase-like metal-dependent hydrolase (beta-lactamase superfamily II)
VKLTKFAHSCVRLDEGDRALVIDPGIFADTETALRGADAVLITHEHPDHVDEAGVRTAAVADPGLAFWAPASVVAKFDDLADRFTVVEPQQEWQVAGFDVRTFGGQHAVIHPLVPVIPNVAYLVNGSVLHPGDSFTVPPSPVETLLLPLHAPWSKISEVIDFAVAVRAPYIHQIHDALLNDTGRSFVEANVSRLTALYGCTYEYLSTGQVREL